MHAASDSAAAIGQRAAVVLAAALSAVLAGCGASSSDRPALDGPSIPASTVAPAPGGPTVTFSGSAVHVAGRPTASAALGKVAVPAGCEPRVERSDPHLVSVVWRCGTTLYAGTVTLDGRLLQLGNVLKGGYAPYLSSVASAQFAVEGRAHAVTADLGTWYLTPDALAVAFPAGVVSYPLASLASYLRDPSAL